MPITRPADAYISLFQKPTMAIPQGHKTIIHWFWFNLRLINNSFVAESAGAAAAINDDDRLRFRLGNWNSPTSLKNSTH